MTVTISEFCAAIGCTCRSRSRDKRAEVVRLVALVARRVRGSGNPNDDFDVLADPENNEFCVCQISEGMSRVEADTIARPARP